MGQSFLSRMEQDVALNRIVSKERQLSHELEKLSQILHLFANEDAESFNVILDIVKNKIEKYDKANKKIKINLNITDDNDI